ncbi:hypothetical protein GCM10027043_29100 [Ferruginibacter profundus]
MLYFPLSGFSQNKSITFFDSAGVKYVSMAAGAQYKASHWKEFWWGKHWREEWMTAVSFPVFNMDTTAGGLTALKRGGGHETKTLRLMGKNGREYVLRTIDKSLDALIPEAFKGSFVNDLVNDQVSTAHPFGPIVIAKLAEGIEILHTNPVIVFVTDNTRLGEFREDFADKLCLFEERPSGDGWENTSLTGYADDITNSEKLFTKLSATNNKSVDQKEFLKVRFLDMLINDWDRHEDQWIWAGKKKDGKTIYEPFARDRDQAFSKTDGISLYFLSRPWALRSVQNMDPTVKDVIGTNLSAKVIDKKFTTALTEDDWIQTITTVQQLLSDSVILNAVKQMPPEIFKLSGDFIYRRLKERRDNMLQFGMRYYKILNREVTITGSDEAELFTINKVSENATEITIQDLNKNRAAGKTIFHRVFDHNTSKEINLYGLGENDQFIFEGRTKNKIRVHVLGGEGTDIYLSKAGANGQGKKTKIYDAPSDKPKPSGTYKYNATIDTSVTNYNRKSFKYDWWVPLLTPGYNPDDGFVIGATVIYKKQQWNKNPFGWMQSIGGNYAASTGAYSLFYKGKFRKAIGKWDFDIAADYYAPAYVLNYYGLGNDTKLNTSEKSYYRVRQKGIYFSPGVSRSWKNITLQTGLLFNTVKIKTADNKFISSRDASLDPGVFTTKYFGGAHLGFVFNNSNNSKYPTKGVIYDATAKWLLNLKESKRSFTNLQSGFTFYYTPFKKLTFAHRTGAATNIGEYEFYQANTIGGHENMRGYWRTRFTGRTSFFQNTDARLQLADLKGYVIRGKIGVYAFFDDGRIWIKDDKSDELHTDYGGGIYFIPYNKLAINIFYASSKEVNVFTIRTGFLF